MKLAEAGNSFPKLSTITQENTQNKIKKSTTSAVPFFGPSIHVRKFGEKRGLGWTKAKAQKNLEKALGKKRR